MRTRTRGKKPAKQPVTVLEITVKKDRKGELSSITSLEGDGGTILDACVYGIAGLVDCVRHEKGDKMAALFFQTLRDALNGVDLAADAAAAAAKAEKTAASPVLGSSASAARPGEFSGYLAVGSQK